MPTKKTYPKFRSFKNISKADFNYCVFSAGVEFENCNNVRLRNCTVIGGAHNVSFYRCTLCTIVGGKLHQPIGVVADKNDPEGHNVLFNQCVNCQVVNVVMTGTTPRGDAINFFNSRNCLASRCSIRGPIAKYGTAAIIDGPKGNGNNFVALSIVSPNANVNICGGQNHIIQNIKVTGSVAITGEYYKNACLSNIHLVNVTGPELYVNQKSVSRLTLYGCKFKLINKS